jgi:hypothetical protein
MRFQLCAILASTTLLLSACGGIGDSAKGTTDAEAAATVERVNTQMAQIRQSTQKAQASLNNAKNALGLLTDANGKFKFSVLFGGVNVSDMGACVKSQFNPGTILFLPQDIANALKCVLDDVVIVVKSVKTDVASARLQLSVAMANLPAGSPQMQMIQAMMTELDQLEASYSTIIHTLASQLTLAVTFLQQLPALATGVCPIPFPGLNMICGGAVYLFLNPLITEITSFQADLMSI